MGGEYVAILKAGDVVRPDVPTCSLRDRVGKVYQRCQAAGWKVCIVVNDLNVVLGRLRREAWEADPETLVEDVMENGPTTFRPDNFLEPLVTRMREKKVGSVILTNPDGVLIGVLYRKDAEAKLNHARPIEEPAK
jgi:CBS domain-containing protein